VNAASWHNWSIRRDVTKSLELFTAVCVRSMACRVQNNGTDIRLNQDRDRESQNPVSIQMDHVIEHRRPDIIVVEKNNNTALLTDIAVLRDTIVEENKKASIR